MNEPEHHRTFREAYTEHQLSKNDKRRKELEELMDRVQVHFGFEEFWEFWETLKLPKPDVIVSKFQGTS